VTGVRARQSRVQILVEAGDFSLLQSVSTSCRSTRALSRVIKQPRHDGDSLPPSSAEVKNEWSCTFAPSVCLHGVHRDIFKLLC